MMDPLLGNCRVRPRHRPGWRWGVRGGGGWCSAKFKDKSSGPGLQPWVSPCLSWSSVVRSIKWKCWNRQTLRCLPPRMPQDSIRRRHCREDAVEHSGRGLLSMHLSPPPDRQPLWEQEIFLFLSFYYDVFSTLLEAACPTSGGVSPNWVADHTQK